MSDKEKFLKCIVIDDDPTITDLIHHYCSKIEEIAYCLTSNDSVSGIKMLSSEDFDVLFLDYNMPDISGKGILEMKNDESKVIMITSHAEFAVDSYSYDGIVDFILKPVTFNRFNDAIQKVIKSLESNPNSRTGNDNVLYLKDGRKWVPVKKDEIQFIKSDSNYVHVKTKSKTILSLMRLKDLEIDLPRNFIRIHRSFIINTNYIDYLTTEVVSVNGEEIPISNKYKNEVLKLIESH